MLANRWIVRKEFFGGILYDTVAKNYFYVDPQTVRGLQQLAGGSTPTMFPHDYLTFLRGHDIIDVDEEGNMSFSGRVIEYGVVPEKFLAAPVRIHFAISYRCSLNCAHCFIKNQERPEEEMETGEIKQLIDRLVEVGTYEILVSGGEPLMRSDLSICLAYALDKGMIVKLFTNGLLLNERKIAELKEFKLNYLAIGFDGPEPLTYSAIRGRAPFERVLRNIQMARKLLDIPIAVQFTCTRRNTDSQTLSRLVDFVVANDVILRVRPVNPCGNALDNPDLMLGYAEYLEVLYTLNNLFRNRGYSPAKVKAKQGNLRFKFSRRSIKFEESPLPYLEWGCPGGYVHAFIDPYGGMHPCGFLISHLPRQEENNIRRRDFLDIWLRGRGFLYKRSLSGNEVCLGCKYAVACRGGCRVRAIYWRGDINAPDQYCRLEYESRTKVTPSFLEGGCLL